MVQEGRDRSALFQLQARQNHFHQNQRRPNKGNEAFQREMRQLDEMFSKFSITARNHAPPSSNGGYLAYNNGNTGQRRRKNGYDEGKRKKSGRTSVAQRADNIRRTIHVSDIDHQIIEEQLAALFLGCGQVVDCRVCGYPNSIIIISVEYVIDLAKLNMQLPI